MSDELASVLNRFSAAMLRLRCEAKQSAPEQLDLFDHKAVNDAVGEKLGQSLATHTFDGTEIHRAVDIELRGLGNETAAVKIKAAIEAKYHGAVPLDAVIEIVGKLLDDALHGRGREGGREIPA
jgi:hypothetical protein